jgi:methylenetetrahydrofolate dehydrogenase (NADP+)/methenyltetrahydrofolate cyclohydrolase
MIIDGKTIANEIAESIKQKVESLPKKPKLAIVLVGDDPASKIYVNLKVKKAKELGIATEVVNDIDKVSPDVDGIIVQLPCENAEKIIQKIPPEKDVDGLRNNSPFLPATVKAVVTLIDLSHAYAYDRSIVIVGQGKLVGKPLVDYLEKRGEKVIRCDEFTKDLKAKTLQADVLVTATGVANLIKKDMIKEGIVIIDCGSPKPEVDVEVYKIAGAYTPVPGGVGPLTVVCLLENLIEAVKVVV